MKKHLAILALVVLAASNAHACEICGCSHSSFQIGLLPSFNKGFVGLRYSYAQFNSHVKKEPGEFSHDYYQTMELWGGYNFKRLQVMTFMPYIVSRKVNDDGIAYSNRMGDMMVLANYRILSKNLLTRNEKTTVRHELYLGGGFKLPTGANHVNPSNSEFNIGDFNSQAGTGSVDYLLNATYNLMWNNSGIVTNVAYRYNTANRQDYKFGNRSYVNSAWYFTLTKGETKIKPNIGLNYQSNTINTFAGADVNGSNGYNLNGTVGLNIIRNKVGINAIGFIPTSQNNFDGQTKLKGRLMIGLTYSF